ncbi:hypothetical protein AVEN_210640-1 [Araneus ventricosus]|uniref:Uncharacterized protein n=1 Tax=Araneus ventricosus TaxID=182803 RepID=A0A4Y2RFC2_ARAVE|nr:hypothetical protein AVEN_210640-1 [Araneus ventricosus]
MIISLTAIMRGFTRVNVTRYLVLFFRHFTVFDFKNWHKCISNLSPWPLLKLAAWACIPPLPPSRYTTAALAPPLRATVNELKVKTVNVSPGDEMDHLLYVVCFIKDNQNEQLLRSHTKL